MSIDKESIVITGYCTACTGCVAVCPVNALVLKGNRLEVIHGLCTRCKSCIDICPVNGIVLHTD
jgi:Fe-S-cluster-containing hydrogenase component 2